MFVIGRWTVPSPAPPQAGVSTYQCASWIGIDGFDGASNSNDLLQVGVQCGLDTTEDCYPWWQWVPGDPHEIGITSVSVNVGDVVFCSVTAFPEYSGGPLKTGSIGFRNVTQSQQTFFEVNLPANQTALIGDSVEWIVERPSNLSSGGYWDLPNYGSVTFDQAYAKTNWGLECDPSAGQPVTMIDGVGNVMSNGSVAYRQVGCTFVSDALPA